jgi:fatty acid desaturase
MSTMNHHTHSPTLDAATLRRLRAVLPAAAFQPAPRKLFGMLALFGLALAAYAAVAVTGLSVWLAGPILLAAFALSALTFASHDLTHGIILRPGPALRISELLFWGLVFMSPTMWRRVHNQTHHAHFNTPYDPDHPLHAGQDRPATRWYVWLFYPNADFFPWNPLVFAHFVTYILRNTLAALLPASWRPAIVPVRPAYSRSDTFSIVGELLVIAAIHTGLFFLTGGRLAPYLAMAVGTQVLTSAVAMVYIFTHHFLNPLTSEADAVRGTTSVIVPAWVDRLHSHLSYHIEHHVFPSMNSDYYPALSRELAREFPADYRRIPLAEAWRQLWKRRAFAPPPIDAGRVNSG